MREGTVYRRFKARDGRRVTLRAPKWEDLDDMQAFINGLVEERAMILMNEPQTRDQEVDWVGKVLAAVEKDKIVAVVAEVEDRFAGSCEINPKRGYSSHVGTLGISLVAEFRDIGIGQEMMLEAEEQARRLRLEIVDLEVFATNARAIHTYEKVGYKVTGRIPEALKYGGGYVDSLIMTKRIA